MMSEAISAEYLALLARAGIAMPLERLAEAVAEYTEIREHVDRVNTACPPDVEPVIQFGPQR